MVLIENVLFLKKHFPNCWEKVKQYEDHMNHEENVHLENSRSSEKTLSIKTENGWNYLHSKYDPKVEAKSLLVKYPEINDYKHILFYGIGLGYHIEEFIELFPQTSFSIYEPNCSVFHSLLQLKVIERWSTKSLKMKNVYIGEKGEDFKQNLTHFVGSVNENVLLIVLPSYERLFKEETKEFVSEFRNALYNKGSDIVANLTFSKRNTINNINNLPTTLKTPNLLHEMPEEFQGKPAILVAAGPSLDFEYENLRKIKENGLAFIFSVGSAINSLIDKNIYPDAACTYDGSEENQTVFQKVKNEGIKEIPLVYGSSVGYETLEKYPGKLANFLVSRDYLAGLCLKRVDDQPLEFVHMAESISIMTLQLLYQLKCNPIILVGQNFAYLDNRTYADGMNFDIEFTAEKKDNAILVKDVEGKNVYTNRGFDIFRQSTERVISHMSNVEVINTTRSGARIEGATFIPLEEVIKEKLTIKNIVSNQWLKQNKSKYDFAYFKERAEFLTTEQESCENIFKMINNLLDEMKRNVELRNKKQIKNNFNKFDKWFDKLQENTFYKMMLEPMNKLKFDSIMKMFNEVRLVDDYEKANRVIKEFTQYITACIDDNDMLKPLLNQTFHESYKTFDR